MSHNVMIFLTYILLLFVFLFSVVPVKFSAQNSKAHYLYLKEHSVRETDLSKPKDKTLFVLNVPPYCDVVGFNLFSDFSFNIVAEIAFVYS